LIMKGFAWYLYGFCRQRQDTRLFKLPRLKQVKVLDIVFKRKHRAYRQTDTRWKSTEKELKVVLKFSNRIKHVVEDYLDDAQVLAQDDRYLTIEITIPDGEWLMGMILSYGPMVEVLAPRSLVKRIYETDHG